MCTGGPGGQGLYTSVWPCAPAALLPSPCHPPTLCVCTPSGALTPLLHLLADIAYRPRKLDRPAIRPPPSDAGELEGQILPLESVLAPVGQEMDPEEDVDEQYRVSVLAAFCTPVAYAGFCCHSMRATQAPEAHAVFICVARGLTGQPLILLSVRKRSMVVLRQSVSGSLAQ